MTNKFFKAIEAEPEVKQRFAKDAPMEIIKGHPYTDSKYLTGIEEVYPTITSDHILKLEELILRVLGKGKIILYFDYSDDGFQGYAYISIFTENQAWNIRYETRQEALLELILKLIEANILTKEEVRKVFE